MKLSRTPFNTTLLDGEHYLDTLLSSYATTMPSECNSTLEGSSLGCQLLLRCLDKLQSNPRNTVLCHTAMHMQHHPSPITHARETNSSAHDLDMYSRDRASLQGEACLQLICRSSVQTSTDDNISPSNILTFWTLLSHHKL